MDSHAGPINVFVATMFVYVTTFRAHLCVLRLFCGFIATFLSCFQCFPFVKFVATKFMNVATKFMNVATKFMNVVT